MRAGIVHGAGWDVAKCRIEKGVEEYEKGEIDFLIMTGRYEAGLMAKYAMKLGVQKSSIGIEDKSRNTIENLYFSERDFLRKMCIKGVECVTSFWHVPRVGQDASVILKRYDVSVIGSIDERIKSEIEKDIKLEKIKMMKDRITLELLQYLYWPERLKNIYGSIIAYLIPNSLFLNYDVYEGMC